MMPYGIQQGSLVKGKCECDLELQNHCRVGGEGTRQEGSDQTIRACPIKREIHLTAPFVCLRTPFALTTTRFTKFGFHQSLRFPYLSAQTFLLPFFIHFTSCSSTNFFLINTMADIFSSHPYPGRKNIQPANYSCEPCEKTFASKDRAAHDRSKGHRLALAKIKAVVEAAEALRNGYPVENNENIDPNACHNCGERKYLQYFH